MKNKKTDAQKWAKALSVTAGFFLFVCAVGGIGFSQTDLGKAAASYDATLKKYKEARLPLTPEDFVKSMSVPADKNAGPRYKAIVSDPKFAKAVGLAVNKPGAKKGAPVTISTADWDSISGPIGEIEKIANRPYCIIPRDWRVPAMTPFPEFAQSKNIIKALALKAQDELAKGDVESAIRHLKLGAKISGWQDSEGFLIGILVRIATAVILEKSLSKMIASHSGDATFIEGCKSVLEILHQPLNIKGVLPAEATFGVTSIDLLEKAGISGFMGDSGPGNQVNDWMFKTGARIPTVRAAWKTRLMEVYLAGANSMPKDFEDYEAVTEMFKAMNKAADHEGLSYIVVRMTEPIFDQFTNAIKKERSSWNVLAQARTAAEIKLKTGRYPQSLPISGRTAEDVIVAGSLLKFDASAGFKVWSIGANKTDDDGVFDALVKKDDFSVILKN